MINKEKFYTSDYYTLKRILEEEKFINFLNESALNELIINPIKIIVESLYHKISGQITNNAYLASVSDTEVDINQKFQETFAEHALFKVIANKDISSNLFKLAFGKLNSRLFENDRFNNEGYFLLIYIGYWLEENLAKAIAKDNRFDSLEVILRLLDNIEPLHHFYNSFIQGIPEEWITSNQTEWIKVSENPKNILDYIRSFDKEYFVGYENRIKEYGKLSDWKFVDDATKYSDYAMFNEEYSFKSHVLSEKHLPSWIIFWDNLRLPLLQDIPFIYITYPYHFLDIAKELKKLKSSVVTPVKHLAFVLLKNFFENSLKATENLSFYVTDIKIKGLSPYQKDEDLISEGAKFYNEWITTKESLYKEILEIISDILSINELSEWVFSYFPRSTPLNDYTERFNAEIKLLTKVFNLLIDQPFEEIVKDIETVFNLQKLEFTVSKLEEVDDRTKHVEPIVNALCAFINSDKFYWDRTFSEPYWPAFKKIGLLLSFSESPTKIALDLLNNFKVNHEGWNVDTNDYKSVNKEVFVCTGCILLLEHPTAFKESGDRENYFKELLNFIITQSRFTVFSRDDEYKMALIMLWLVVNQVLTDMKEYFEAQVIELMDNIDTVIEVLSHSKYQLSKNAKKRLGERLDIEFNIEKRKLMQRGQNNEVVRLEKLVEQLNIKPTS